MESQMKKLVMLAIALLFVAPIFADTVAGDFISSEVLAPVASTAFTVPATASVISFSIRNAGVHMRFDGNAATTNDLYLPPGLYRMGTRGSTTNKNNIKVINSTDGAATVFVFYFKKQ
jgi:hypothetical protein